MKRSAISFFLWINIVAFGQELPKGLETCRRSDTNINNCLVKTIHGGLNFFKKGYSPLKIPILDPYHVKFIEAQHAQGNSNFNLRSSLKNANVIGLIETTKITRVASKFGKKFALKVETFSDNFEISGDYTMKGQILVLPINGIGKCNVSMTDVKAVLDFRGDFIEKNGETYVNLSSLKVKLTPKHTYFLFENVFNGDPTLSQTINSFMNENWLEVTNTLVPGYEDKLGEEFKVVANFVFNNFPFKLIFPE